MHVAFLTTEYPPLPSGGIGTSIRNLGRALVRQGHRVTVLGWGAEASFEDRGVRVRFRRTASARGLGWLAMRRHFRDSLASLIANEGLQIVEAPDWCGISAGLAPQCPIVVRCNGSATYFAHLGGERVRPLMFGTEWLAVSRAAGVVAVSRFTAETTRRLFRLRRPVDMIPNGIDLTLFPAASASAVEPGLVLFAGTVQRKKGALDVCRIFSRIVEEHPEALLRLIGRDCADPETGASSTWALCREILSAEALRRTEYLGPQPYEAVHEHLRRAAVCLLPSHAEALPLAWLEAMASARTVVAYDVGWAPEVVEHGRSGLLVQGGDIAAAAAACLSVLRDPRRGETLGRTARTRVATLFSDDVVARRSSAWYEQVLDGWRGRNAPASADRSVVN